ncbi:MAG: MerR family transcriptional regulator [Nannocystaceae bacterium]
MSVSLTEAQIREIEASHAEGLSSQELVAVFSENQIRFSEANLRRYVQLGLVPRSRRVGRKGKHLGSRGVYPVRSVRRINTIKRLMADRYTIEEIQAKLLVFKDSIEVLDEAVEELVRVFENRVAAEPPSTRRDRLQQELQSIRQSAGDLLTGVQRLEKLLVSTQQRRRPRGGGAASPTELL